MSRLRNVVRDTVGIAIVALVALFGAQAASAYFGDDPAPSVSNDPVEQVQPGATTTTTTLPVATTTTDAPVAAADAQPAAPAPQEAAPPTETAPPPTDASPATQATTPPPADRPDDTPKCDDPDWNGHGVCVAGPVRNDPETGTPLPPQTTPPSTTVGG